MGRMHNLRPRQCAAATVIFLAVMAGCGGGGGGSIARTNQGNQEAVTLSTNAEDNVFNPETLRVPAGAKVTVNVDNTGETVHTFTIRDLNVDTGNIDPGKSKTVTFTAPDETTQFICVPHELEGMTGELLIED